MKYLAGLLLFCGCLHQITGKMLSLPDGCTTWTPLPLRVSLAPNAWRYHQDIEQAIAMWNEALGTTAFVMSDRMPQVLVVSGVMENETEKGFTEYECKGGEVVSTVFVNRRLVGAQNNWVVIHEFGHALGLGHSTNGQSVMQRGLSSVGWYRITESDVDLFYESHKAAGILPKTNERSIVAPVPSVSRMKPGVCRPPLWSDDEHAVGHPVELAKHADGVHYMLHHVRADDRTERLVRVGKCMGVAVTDFGAWSVEVTIDVAPESWTKDRCTHR